MLIKKEVLTKGSQLYSLSLIKKNGNAYSVIANTKHKKITRGAGLNMNAALSLFDKVITQKHYEHYITEHVFNTKCPYTIDDLSITPTKQYKDNYYIQPEMFQSLEIPMRSKRCFISFGVFNSNKIEVFNEQKILQQSFVNERHIDEFIVEAYVEHDTFYIVDLLCTNSIDVKQLSTQNVLYWLNTLLGHYDGFNYCLATPATDQSHRIIHIENNKKVSIDEFNGSIYYGLVNKVSGTSIVLTGNDLASGKSKRIGKFDLPQQLVNKIKVYDVVSYFIPTNTSDNAYIIDKCQERTSADCIVPSPINTSPKRNLHETVLADLW